MFSDRASREQLRGALEDKLCAQFGVQNKDATDEQVFRAAALVVRERMSRILAFEQRDYSKKEVHYLSMEFLMGRSLEKNAYNLGIKNALYGALRDMGRNPDEVFGREPDAGLGNGGLGRLAACFMDSMASLGIEATGYSICYELGIFRQIIEDGGQKEEADVWRSSAESWLVPCYDDSCEVRFGGRVQENWDNSGLVSTEYIDYTPVIAIPRDMLVVGYEGNNVNTLRLWEAHSPNSVDMFKFSVGEYVASMEQRTMAEVITKVLYPADDHISGKTLRLKQQYFFVSATAQTLVKKHRKRWLDVSTLHEHHAVQINDTHPSLVIPELMRILMDEDGLGWDKAWNIVCNTVMYTNHTVMKEALESWPQGLVQNLLPRIYEIICEINKRWRKELEKQFKGNMSKVSSNAIIDGGQIHMARMCVAASKKVNGVSGLHGQILSRELFGDIWKLNPDKFTFVTNGIDHRRWLAQINPELHELIVELIGDGYLREPTELEKLMEFEHDKNVHQRLREIKKINKQVFVDYLYQTQGEKADISSVFDVQVKRLHEYKRQFMCAMLITHLRNQLRDNPNMDFTPRTFIFGAKAAPSYTTAKRIIELICSLAEDIEQDKRCKGKLQVVFLENYRVSTAERLMPASQISQQISTAGKEASGTGNMKLMQNGAITIGTLDGANVEMLGQLGNENMFLFGMNAEEVATLAKGPYDPSLMVRESTKLSRIFNRFSRGFSDGKSYSDLVTQMIYGGDPYMHIADFDSYVSCYERMYSALSDETEFARMSLVNIAKSGLFAADRAISEYAKNIWRI